MRQPLLRTVMARLPESLRARLVRLYRPRFSYLLFPRTGPISRSHWTDRGEPIDRFFIERFLHENRGFIRGACLEVKSADYTRRFGAGVTRADVLDIDAGNGAATVRGDLRRLDAVADASYDCVLLTQVLQYIDALPAAVGELFRILKPGGTALITVPSMQKLDRPPNFDYWRFTPHSLRYLLAARFPDDERHLHIQTWGNVLTGMAAWIGLALEEVRPAQLEHHDPLHPGVVSARATKPAV